MIISHMIILCLTFWQAAKLFSKIAVLVYIPTGNAWGFHFLHILDNTCYLSFLLLDLLVGIKTYHSLV